MRWFMIALVLNGLTGSITAGQSPEFFVYSVYQGLSLGNAEEIPPKDFYMNMGSIHGVREGSILEVWRRTPTYDIQAEKFYRDVTFPIARVKVIHVEKTVSIARLEKFLAPQNTPTFTPKAIMVGDHVKLIE
jgi:hypothetical protein